MTHNTKTHRHSERGNALWFILIAVVLLGLLTSVLSRSGSNVEQTGSFETASIEASRVLKFVKGVEAAVNRMTLNGISENAISFARDTNNDGVIDTNDTDFNANCTETNCLVYDVEGGGISYQDPPNGIHDGSDYIYVGALSITDLGEDNGDAFSSELLMMLENVSEDFCVAINRILDVDNSTTPGTPPNDTGTSAWSPNFEGTFEFDDEIGGADLNGRNAACYDDNTSPTAPATPYKFYYTLIVR